MAHKKILTLGAIMVALVAVTGISIASHAAEGPVDADNSQRFNNRWQNSEEMQARKAQFKERNEAARQALDNADYQAWVEAVGDDCPALEKIDESNFSRLVEAHNLAKQGREKFEEARQIKEDLGLKARGPAKRMMNGQDRIHGSRFAPDVK